jgi:hypothetical protein
MGLELSLMLAAVAIGLALFLLSRRVRTISKECVAHPRDQAELDTATQKVTARESR